MLSLAKQIDIFPLYGAGQCVRNINALVDIMREMMWRRVGGIESCIDRGVVAQPRDTDAPFGVH